MESVSSVQSFGRAAKVDETVVLEDAAGFVEYFVAGAVIIYGPRGRFQHENKM